MKRSSPFILLAFCLLLTACGMQKQGAGESWLPVEAETGPKVLKEIGILEAKELARIQNMVSGTISEVVEDGVRVKKGDILLKLDDEELRSNLESKIEELDQIREDLENELAEYAVLTNSFEMTRRVKQAELDHANLEMKTQIISLTPEEKRLGEIDIALAKLDLEDKKSRFEREEELVRKKFAPASSLQTVQREMEAAETYLEEKQTQLSIDSLPLPEEERLTLETKVRNAEETVRRNQEQQNRDLRILDLKIEGLELKIKHTLKVIDDMQGQVREVSRIAPTDGIIRLTQKWQWSIRGWLPISAGQRIRDLEIVGGIVDPNDLSLRVIVHESDFPLVKTGQVVRARLTGFPNKELKGIVSSVTELGQDRNDLSPIYRQSPAIHQALFLVRISLEKIGDGVIPGMTAVAEIQIGAEQQRISIPVQATHQLDHQVHVTRRRKGTIKDVVVTGHEREDGRFEVTAGLEVGDEILILGDEI